MPGPSTTAVRALAASLTTSPCYFILDTETQPLTGGECIIYALETLDQQRLSIRIRKDSESPYAALHVKEEAQIRRLVDRANLKLFQSLIGFSDSSDNTLGVPFLALSWIDGRPLAWSDSCPATENVRHDVLRSVANASIDLLQINMNKGSGLDWIQSKIRRKIARAESGNLPGATVAECQRQMDLIRDYWIPELDDTPHVLVHGDISSNNVIVHDNRNTVQGIIDFGWAEFVPFQFAAVYPKFLTHEPVPVQGGGYDWSQRRSAQMDRDRAFYLDCVEERAVQEGANRLVMDYFRILSRDDEIRRHWWVAAASSIAIHKAMTGCDWHPPTTGFCAAN